MSKIARIYQGTNEIQKYYQGGVLQRLFFDWKHYIGNELNIEYAKECSGRNIVISGKTIQDSNDLSNIESIGEKEDNLVTIRNYNYKCDTDNVVLPNGTKNSIETIDGKKVHVQRVMKIVLDGTTTKATLSRYWLCPSVDYMSWFFTRYDSQLGIGRPTCISSDPNFPYREQNYLNVNKGAIRTGDDYTFKLAITIRNDLLEEVSLNGINNYLKKNPITVHIACKPIYTYLESGLYDDIVLPDGTKNEISYSNGKHIHTRKIGKYILSGNENISVRVNNSSSSYISFNIDISNMEKSFTDYNNSYKKMICDKLEVPITNEFGDDKSATKECIMMRGSGLGVSIALLKSKLETEDAEGLKTWLSENPVTIYYELYSFVDTELYYDNITYKLNEPLRSLPNGVCDTIEEGKIVRRVGMDIFNGSDNVKLGTDATQFDGYFTGTIAINNIKKSSCLICDKFLYSSINSLKSECIFASASVNTGIRIRISNDKATDVATFKTWLSENPVTVYYELETPEEQEITPNMILINGEPITDTVGIELPDGTKDSIENGCYVKRVGKVVLDGSYDEKWKIESTNKNNLMNASILIKSACDKSREDIKKGKIGYFFFSDKLPKQCTQITFTTTEGIMMDNMYIYVRILLSKLSSQDIDGLRNYLSGNPVTVWYELATPVKIPLFSIKEGLTTLKSTNNITPQIELDCLVRDDFQNMCDNTWVNGDITIATGDELSSSTSRIKLQDYIAVQPNTTYYCDTFSETVYSNTGKIAVRYYKKDNTYISGGGIGVAKTSYNKFTTPEDCYYIKFIVETLDTNYKMYLRPVREMN